MNTRKTLLWSKKIRVFWDKNNEWHWIPKIKRSHFQACYGLFGIKLYVWKSLITISFGEDINNLYDKFKEKQ